MIDDYLRELEARLPATGRGRLLAEAEDHLRTAAAAHVTRGLAVEAAEGAAVRAFGPPEEVARRLAPLAAAVAVRRAAVVGLVAAAGLVLPLYGIPENTLPPAPWAERPALLSALLVAGVVCWLAATVLAALACVLGRGRPRGSSWAVSASAAAVALAALSGMAALAVWHVEADSLPGWQPILAVPAALACALAAAAAARWARARAPVAAS